MPAAPERGRVSPDSPQIPSHQRAPFHALAGHFAGYQTTSSSKAAVAPNDQPTVTTDAAATHDADEYNWSGFSCPYCSASSFVSGACGHLTCNGTNELRNGRYFHQCFCGHAGFISGTIKSFKGTWLSAEREVDSTNGPNPERPQQSSKSVDVTILPSTHAPPAKR